MNQCVLSQWKKNVDKLVVWLSFVSGRSPYKAKNMCTRCACLSLCVCIVVNNCGFILIFLALWPTFVHTASFFGNGENREYMLSKKLLITQQGVWEPRPHYTVFPLWDSPHIPVSQSRDLSSAAHSVSPSALFLHRSIWSSGKLLLLTTFPVCVY